MPFNFTEYKNKYNKDNYDALRIVVPKGKREAIDVYAKAHGETINGIVNRLLREEMGLTKEQWRERSVNADTEENP